MLGAKLGAVARCTRVAIGSRSRFAPPLHQGRSPAPNVNQGFRSSTAVQSLQTAIVGLPNVGKSTLFNAIVQNGKAASANFPFCTIEPNSGIVTVPDDRLQVLAEISKSKDIVPTTFEFVDVAGLVKGASNGEGLGNQFLGNIRTTDAIVQVVRAFDDDDVIHVSGRVSSVDDVDIINLELALADLGQIEKRLDKLKKGKKSKEEQEKNEMEAAALMRIQQALEAGKAARTVELDKEEMMLIKSLGLITLKPMIYAANVPEDDLADKGANNPYVQALRARAAEEGLEVAIVSAKVESELMELPKEEAQEWLEALGVKDGGLANLIRATYAALGLRTYFTTGEKETRAWTISAGMTAPQAAGTIHSDFEKGFIRAETIAYDDYVKAKGYSAAKEAGMLRSEGKEYVVQEGDVLLFRFNV
mmetsp:Transcript_20403/g.56860  ORF Transcript_20403/g.56860 Transcript_20403/m.56860 type:complete len:418 (-) Transcript_20403:250-1503(-)